MQIAVLLEALKAVRDTGGVLAALKSLQQGLHADGPRFLLSLLQLTPDLAALTGLWDATKDVPISSALLTVLTDVLITVRVACAWHEQPSSDSQTTGEEALTPAQILMLTKTGDMLVSHIIQSKMRTLYFALSSGNRALAHPVLALLTAVAAHSSRAAGDLLTALDMSLSALPQLARPPREKETSEAGPSAAPLHSACQRSWKQWRSASAVGRPSRALIFDLVLALLRNAGDVVLARKLLPAQGLMGAVLAHLVSDPPGAVLQLLRLIAARVLGPGTTIPPSVCGGLWGDAALMQLAELAGSAPGPDSEAEEQPHTGLGLTLSKEQATPSAPQLVGVSGAALGSTGAAAQALAGQAAAEVLVVLLTQSAQGLVGEALPLDVPLPTAGRASAAAAAEGSENVDGSAAAGQGSGGWTAHGCKRVLRLLARLRPSERPLHAAVIQAVAVQQPGVMADFVGNVGWQLEPQASSSWVARIMLASRLVAVTAAAPLGSQLVARMRAATAAMEAAAQNVGSADPISSHGAAWAMIAPPGIDSQTMRLGLRRCLPPALSKAVLQRGLQRTELLVVLVTLSTLLASLSALQPLFQAAAEAATAERRLAAAHAVNAGGGASCLWQQHLRRLRATVRARLPDLNVLLACCSVSGASATPSAPYLAEGGQDGHERVEGQGLEGKEEGEDLLALEAHVVQTAQHQVWQLSAATTSGQAPAAAGADAAGQECSLPPPSKQAVLTGLALQALALVTRLLPDSFAAAHLDPFKLLPAPEAATNTSPSALGVLSLHPAVQAAWLQVVLHMQAGSREESAGLPSGSHAPALEPLATGQLLPLLRLMAAGALPGIRADAGHACLALLHTSSIFRSASGAHSTAPLSTRTDEAVLWLSCLPLHPPSVSAVSGSPTTSDPMLQPEMAGGPCTADACLTFLADVLVTVSRRPHEAWEMAQHAQLAAPGADSSPAALVSSVTPIALRSCLRALRSPRMPATTKAALATYVSCAFRSLACTWAPGCRPQALLAVMHQALAADGAQAATASTALGRPPSGAASARLRTAPSQGGSEQELPAEAHLLLDLLPWLEAQCRDPTSAPAPQPGASGHSLGGGHGSAQPWHALVTQALSSLSSRRHGGNSAHIRAAQATVTEALALAATPAAALELAAAVCNHCAGIQDAGSGSARKKRAPHIHDKAAPLAPEALLFSVELVARPLLARGNLAALPLQVSDHFLSRIGKAGGKDVVAAFSQSSPSAPSSSFAAPEASLLLMCLAQAGAEQTSAVSLLLALQPAAAAQVMLSTLLTSSGSWLAGLLPATLLSARHVQGTLHLPLALVALQLAGYSPGGTTVSQQGVAKGSLIAGVRCTTQPAPAPLGGSGSWLHLDALTSLVHCAQACQDASLRTQPCSSCKARCTTGGSTPCTQCNSQKNSLLPELQHALSHAVQQLCAVLSVQLSGSETSITAVATPAVLLTCLLEVAPHAQPTELLQAVQQLLHAALCSLQPMSTPSRPSKKARPSPPTSGSLHGTATNKDAAPQHSTSSSLAAAAVQAAVLLLQKHTKPHGDLTSLLPDLQLLLCTLSQGSPATSSAPSTLLWEQHLALRDQLIAAMAEAGMASMLSDAALHACLTQPTPAASCVMAELVTSGCLSWARVLGGLSADLQQSQTADQPTAAAAKRGAAGITQPGPAALAHRQSLAFLLPLAVACLAQAAAAPALPPGTSEAVQHVVAMYRAPLLAYTHKRRRAHEPLAPVEAALSGGADQAVAAMLHAHGVPVLLHCLAREPCEPAAAEQLWTHLVPSSGEGWPVDEKWALHPVAGPAQKAQCAMSILLHYSPTEEQLSSISQGSHSDNDDAPTVTQHIHRVTALLTACCSTLAHVYRQQASSAPLPDQPAGAQLQTLWPAGHLLSPPSSSSGRPTRHWSSSIAEPLAVLLDGQLGNLIAALPNTLRTSPEYTSCCLATAQLQSAVLQSRGNDPAAVRLVRRLAAALVPDPGNEDSHSSHGSDSSEEAALDSTGHPACCPVGDSDEAPPPQLPEFEDGSMYPMHSESIAEQLECSSSSSGDGEGGSSQGSEGDSSDFDECVLPEGGVTEEPTMGLEPGAADVLQQVSQLALPDVATVVNAEAARAVGNLLGSLVSAPAFLAAVLAPACPSALPKHVLRVPVPVPSLAPFVSVQQSRGKGQAGTAAGGPSTPQPCHLKLEFLLLLETLLGLRRSLAVQAPSLAHPMSDSDSDDVGHVTAHRQPPQWPASPAESNALATLLASLLPAYGATLDGVDRVCLRVLLLLDALLAAWHMGDASLPLLSVRAVGPLAHVGYLWGEAAAALPGPDRVTACSSVEGLDASSVATVLRAQRTSTLEARRVALTCVLFPGGRTAAADETTEEEGSFGPGADPAWLLPFTLTCLRGGALELPQLLDWGLLSMVLRSTAAHDAGLRAMAYEAVALFLSRMEAVEGHAQAGARHAGRSPDDFRERVQVLALLHHARAGVTHAMQRLPDCVALWLAESAAALTVASSQGHRHAAKALLSTDALPTAELPSPLLRCLHSSTSSKNALELRLQQEWALALLLAGLQGPTDGVLYQRRFVVQQAMALAQSPCLLDQTDPGTVAALRASSASEPEPFDGCAALALEVVAHAASISPLAQHLVKHAGLVHWLASHALHHMHMVLALMTTAAQPLSQATRAGTSRIQGPLGHNTMAALVALEALTVLASRAVGCSSPLSLGLSGAAGHSYLQAVSQVAPCALQLLRLARTGQLGVGGGSDCLVLSDAVQILGVAVSNGLQASYQSKLLYMAFANSSTVLSLEALSPHRMVGS